MNQLDVGPRDLGQGGEISGVRRQDYVTIRGEEDQRCIDDVVGSAATQEDAGPASACVVERDDLHGVEQPCEKGLSRSAAPDLTDDPAVGYWDAAGTSLGFEYRNDRSIAALDGDQGTGVENDRHRREVTAKVQRASGATAAVLVRLRRVPARLARPTRSRHR